MNSKYIRMHAPMLGLLALAGLGGCGGDDGEDLSGDDVLTVALEAEDTITEGLEPGEDLENLVDGWTVTFDNYIVAIGEVTIGRKGGDLTVEGGVVVDLTKLPTNGFELARFTGIAAGQWPEFFYEQVHAEDGTRDDSVSEDDYARMVDEELTYLIRGTATKDDESIDFEFAVPAEVTYGPCESEEGAAGVNVTEMGESAASVVIHGDHIFFNGFPSGAEVVERRAAWLAAADALTGADGELTTEDLEGISGTDLAGLFPTGAPANEGDAQYFLSGSPMPIETALDFVKGQLVTQGHFNGEGECPWTLDDGTSGAHDHDHGDDGHDH